MQHQSLSSRNALRLTLIITVFFLLVELVGGVVSNSLALLSDASHMLSDVAALGLSLFAMGVARKPPTPRKTFGFYRVEILVAMINALTLMGISLVIFYAAYQRIQHPPQVQSTLMMIVAAAGLVANLFGAWLLLPGGRDGQNLNLHGAFLHVVGDALGSIGALLGGFIMAVSGWYLADPLISVLIGVLILYNAGRLLRETVDVLLEGTPPHISFAAVEERLGKIKGVAAVHDLHIWTVTSGLVSMSCHVVLEPGSDGQAVLQAINECLARDFTIEHTTVQIEVEDLRHSEIHV